MNTFTIPLIFLALGLAWGWREEGLMSRARLRSNNSLSDECDRLEAEKLELNGQIVMLREALRSQAAVTVMQAKAKKPTKTHQNPPRKRRLRSAKGRW